MIPSSKSRDQGFLEKWQTQRWKQERYKINLEYLVVTKSRGVLKKKN